MRVSKLESDILELPWKATRIILSSLSSDEVNLNLVIEKILESKPEVLIISGDYSKQYQEIISLIGHCSDNNIKTLIKAPFSLFAIKEKIDINSAFITLFYLIVKCDYYMDDNVPNIILNLKTSSKNNREYRVPLITRILKRGKINARWRELI